MNILDIINLSYNYNRTPMLQQINLKMKQDDFLAIVGPDDSGKTTLLHIIMGFLTNYQGNLMVFNKAPGKWNAEERSRIRFVPDNILWETRLTAEEYFNYLRKYNTSGKYNSEFQQQLCKEFAIPTQNKLLDLTYQENKFVQITGAICASPQLLILDEPVNFLSEAGYSQLMDKLHQLHKNGMNILIAAEKYEHVKGYCSKYTFIRNGRLEDSKNIPPLDKRRKIITLTGDVTDTFRNAMEQCLKEQNKCSVFVYNGDPQQLPTLLNATHPTDILIDEMTLEEELEQDFSRWE